VKLRRDIILFGVVAIAALAGGWWVLTKRPGLAIETFSADYRREQQVSQPRLPPADAFRATVCAASPCVAVEAGGLSFVFGAGRGAAEGLRSLGLLHASIDGILLPDLSLSNTEGLSAIAVGSSGLGRTGPITVYGPNGSLPVIDGANLLASSAAAARLVTGAEGEDQGLAGRLVFDSGVVAVRSFGGQDRGASRVYRVDFDDKSMILAGCQSRSADVITAARGARLSGGVALAGAPRLTGGKSSCTELGSVLSAARQGGLSMVMIVPADPAADRPNAVPAWNEVLSAEGVASAKLGLPGTILDLTGLSAPPRKTENPRK
jgi:hypothetical protein